MINDHGPSAFKIIPHWFHKTRTPNVCFSGSCLTPGFRLLADRLWTRFR